MLWDNLRGSVVWLAPGLDAPAWRATLVAALAAAGAILCDSAAQADRLIVDPASLAAALTRGRAHPPSALVIVGDAALESGEPAGDIGTADLEAVRTHGAVRTLTRHWARRLAPHTRVNALLAVIRLDGPEHLHRIPMNRLPTPAEIAEVLLFLLAGNDFMTGSVLTLDGGWLL